PRLGSTRYPDAVRRGLLSDEIVADPESCPVDEDARCGRSAAVWRQVPHPIAAYQAAHSQIIAGSDAVRRKGNAAVTSHSVDDFVDRIAPAIHDNADSIDGAGLVSGIRHGIVADDAGTAIHSNSSRAVVREQVVLDEVPPSRRVPCEKDPKI